jgi:hypothetical protein
MTNQAKITIEAGDIIAIEITCAQCGCVISQKVAAWTNSIAKCPACNASWLPYRQSLLYIEDLAVRLRHLSALSEELPTPSVAIRFEISSEKTP